MRIIKGEGEAASLLAIAGEMLNIETSTLAFLDGELVDSPLAGYPRIADGDVLYTIRAAGGIIFVNPEVDTIRFIKALETAIDVQFRKYMKLGRPAPLTGYHAVKSGFHTITRLELEKLSRRNRRKPARFSRHDVPATETSGRSREIAFGLGTMRPRKEWNFLWRVMYISVALRNDIRDDAHGIILADACSIYYDNTDVCNLSHNEIAPWFQKSLMRGAERMNLAEEAIALIIGSPLAMELSNRRESRRPRGGDSNKMKLTKFGNLTAPVYHGEHHWFKLRPTQIGGKEESSTGICSSCKSVLYGDNYVLSYSKNFARFAMAVCPLCLHFGEIDDLSCFNAVYRVTFPRTVEDMIEAAKVSAERKDIYREALKGVVPLQHRGGNDTQITLVGDKYALFNSTDDFLYSGENLKKEELRGRIICKGYFYQ